MKRGEVLCVPGLSDWLATSELSRLQPTPHLPPASAGGEVAKNPEQPALAGLGLVFRLHRSQVKAQANSASRLKPAHNLFGASSPPAQAGGK